MFLMKPDAKIPKLPKTSTLLLEYVNSDDESIYSAALAAGELTTQRV